MRFAVLACKRHRKKRVRQSRFVRTSQAGGVVVAFCPKGGEWPTRALPHQYSTWWPRPPPEYVKHSESRAGIDNNNIVLNNNIQQYVPPFLDISLDSCLCIVFIPYPRHPTLFCADPPPFGGISLFTRSVCFCLNAVGPKTILVAGG